MRISKSKKSQKLIKKMAQLASRMTKDLNVTVRSFQKSGKIKVVGSRRSGTVLFTNTVEIGVLTEKYQDRTMLVVLQEGELPVFVGCCPAALAGILW